MMVDEANESLSVNETYDLYKLIRNESENGGHLIFLDDDSSLSSNVGGNAFFHLYQSFVFLSVVLPWIATVFSFHTRSNYSVEIYSLCALFFAHICGFVWASLPGIRMEALPWMIVISLFCTLRLVHTCYRIKPIMFDPEIEEVYVKLFKPLRLNARQFNDILKCMRGICSLLPGEELVSEKVTRVDSLSLVVTGRLLVTQNGKPLHFVPPHQFIDSPEWFGVTTDEFFQISATALEESRVLIWHRDRLKLTLMKDQFLQTIFEHIIGRDVVKKLTQSQQEGNNDINTIKYLMDCEDSESEKTWVVAKSDIQGGVAGNSSNGIVSKLLVNTIEGSSTWSLARISEHDDETPV